MDGTRAGIKNFKFQMIYHLLQIYYMIAKMKVVYLINFQVVPEEHISVTYDSKIIPTEDLFKRSDMFNVFKNDIRIFCIFNIL